MNTIVPYDDSVDIQGGISDLARFRRQVHSDDFAETGCMCSLGGRVWVDKRIRRLPTRGMTRSPPFALAARGLLFSTYTLRGVR